MSEHVADILGRRYKSLRRLALCNRQDKYLLFEDRCKNDGWIIAAQRCFHSYRDTMWTGRRARCNTGDKSLYTRSPALLFPLCPPLFWRATVAPRLQPTAQCGCRNWLRGADNGVIIFFSFFAFLGSRAEIFWAVFLIVCHLRLANHA